MNTGMNLPDQIKELSRIRNRQTAKFLDYLGNPDEQTVMSVKRAFTRFAADVEKYVLRDGTRSIHGNRMDQATPQHHK